MPHLQQADGGMREQAVHYQPAVENNSFYIAKTDMQGRYTFMDSFSVRCWVLIPGTAWAAARWS